MTIESAIHKTLIDSAGVHAVVADRIYAVVAEQDVDSPFVVWERVGVDQEYTQQGKQDLQTARFRFRCSSNRSSAYADCVNVDSAIVTALGSLKGLFGDNSVKACGSFFEQPDDNFYQESGLFVRTRDLDIQFK